MLKNLQILLVDLTKKKVFYVLLLLLLGQVMLSSSIPYLIGQLLDNLEHPAVFSQLLAIFSLILIVSTILQIWAPRLYNHLIETYVGMLRQQAVDKLYALPISEIDRLGKGDLLSRITVDSQQLTQGMTMIFSQLVPGSFTILLTLFLMGTMNMVMTLFVLAMSPLSILVAKGIAKRSYKTYQIQTQTRGKLVELLSERIDQLNLVQVNNAQSCVNQEFQKLNQTYAEESFWAIFYGSTINPMTRFINAMIYTGLVALGLNQLLSGRMTLGQLTSFLTYVNHYTKPFNDISSVFAELQSTLACFDRLQEILILSADEQSSYGRLEEVNGRVDFEQVSFAYHPAQKLMSNLKLHIPAGSMVGIVGPTGAGKSTFINLLMRYYQPSQGKIFLDKYPIDQLAPEDFYDQIAIVLQETWLKKVSVAENIAYGRPSASREDIVAAAKAANADFFIRQLPQGYDTILDPSHITLSQGQKQLLAIARVFLKSPKIMIFDEATASLDSLTEGLVQEAVRQLMVGRTSFIIAHRLATVRHADLILVMKDGDVVEQGNHDQLLAKNGLYAEMVEAAQNNG